MERPDNFVPGNHRIWTRRCIFQAPDLIVVPNHNRNKDLGPVDWIQIFTPPPPHYNHHHHCHHRNNK